MDYIDELIAIMWTGPLGDVYDHVLQDANYNIVAHAYANTAPAVGVRHQFRYHAYGQWTYENAGGGERLSA